MSDILKILLFFISIISLSAYLSLYERKLIGRIQRRKGPSYCGFFGLFQPIADGLKLLLKSNPFNNVQKTTIIAISSLLFFSLVQFAFLPISSDICFIRSDYSLLYIMIFHELISLSEIILGITSPSKYGLIGGMRGILQKLIGDILFLLFIFISVLSTRTFDISIIRNSNFLSIINGIIFFIMILINTNHTPFDFLEAESELVAGTVTEYGGILFGIIFLANYINIIFNSALLVILFCNKYEFSFFPHILIFCCKVLIIISILILIRAIFPRFTQKQSIVLSWIVVCISLIANTLFN